MVSHSIHITVVILPHLEPQLEALFKDLAAQERQPGSVILLSNMEVPQGEWPFKVIVEHHLFFAESYFDRIGHLAILPARSRLEPTYLARMCAGLEAYPEASLAISPPSSYMIEPVPRRRDPRFMVLDEGFHNPQELAMSQQAQGMIGPQFVLSVHRPDEIPIGDELGVWGLWLVCHFLAYTRGVVYVDEVLAYHYEIDQPPETPDMDRAKAILNKITAEPFDVLLPFFALSGAGRVLGIDIARVIQQEDAFWRTDVQMAFQHNFFELNEYERRLRFDNLGLQGTDLRAALLPRVKDVVKRCHEAGFEKVAFYGIGTQTRYLADLWTELSGPTCIGLITTEPPRINTFHGLPISRIHDFDKASVDAVIFSSTTHEEQMAQSSRFMLRELPRFALWNPELTQIPNGMEV